MLMLFMGVAALLGLILGAFKIQSNFSGPPFAKMLKNWTGDYGLSFHIMGVLMVLRSHLRLQ